MALKGTSLSSIVLLGAGGLFFWSSVHGASITGSLRDLVSGKQPSGAQVYRLNGPQAGQNPAPFLPSGGNWKANRAIGKTLAMGYGWGTGPEWDALDWIATVESGWSATVVNESSGAAGIAQRISGFGPGYQKGNAPQQILWMLRYIEERYKDPIRAKAFHLANGYY